MVLIGDASHATPPAAGQGSSLAMEDAVVLAQGHRTSSAKSPPPVGRLVRDLVMPVVLRRHDPQAWVRAHHVDWDAPAVPA